MRRAMTVKSPTHPSKLPQHQHSNSKALTASAQQQRDDACTHQDKHPPKAKQAVLAPGTWPSLNGLCHASASGAVCCSAARTFFEIEHDKSI
jgi:hypothetical protein